MDFETASHVFEDKDRLELYDELHSEFEDKYITIGMIDEITCIAMVVYTEQGTDVIRIISPRKATPKERRKYYDHS